MTRRSEHWGPWCRRAGVCLLALSLLVGSPRPAISDDALAVRVNSAIDRGVKALTEAQKDDGSWGTSPHVRGQTALAALALLHSDMAPTDPPLRKATAFLGIAPGGPKYSTPTSTYEAACILLLLDALRERAPASDHRSIVKAVATWLVERLDSKAGWNYGTAKGTDTSGRAPDLSNTHFALIGLNVARPYRVKVPPAVWRRAAAAILRLRARDGSFSYDAHTLTSGAMTYAALTCLEIANRNLPSTPRGLTAALDSGHNWSDSRFSVRHPPFGNGWRRGYYYYYMYAMADYARTFKLKEIGGKEWYRLGAIELLHRQREDGSWSWRPEATSFALLFLERKEFTPSGPSASQGEPEPLPLERRPRQSRPDVDVPYFSTWLVVGPFFPSKKPSVRDDMLDYEPFDVKRSRPVPGRAVGRLEWTPADVPPTKDPGAVGRLTLPDDLPDRSRPTQSDYALYCAAVYLHAPEDTMALLWLGSRNGVRVYLRGQLLELPQEGHHHENSNDKQEDSDFYSVPLALVSGANQLLFKTEVLRGSCYLQARLSDPDGKHIKHVRTSLTPKPVSGR